MASKLGKALGLQLLHFSGRDRDINPRITQLCYHAKDNVLNRDNNETNGIFISIYIVTEHILYTHQV